MIECEQQDESLLYRPQASITYSSPPCPLNPPRHSSKHRREKTTKCRGIELVQGLADAAVDHLQTAKTFLSNPRVPLDNTDSANTNTEVTLPGEGSTAVVVGAPRGIEKLGRGSGGGRKGKKAPCKAANQGLSAVDLEALIAGLLSRQPLLPQALCIEAGETGGDGATARDVREATAEEVASWLVRDLGHRRQVDNACTICY